MLQNSSHERQAPAGCFANCRLDDRAELTEEKKQVEKLIAQEIYDMSTEERTGVYQDLHGVSDGNKEEPEFVQKCRNEMEIQLLKNPNRAFQLAWHQSSQYVQSLYLMFLRCDDFRVSDAAERLLKYFEAKLELFRSDKLACDITQEDLSADDMEALKTGAFQILQCRDRAGRLILCLVGCYLKYKVPENVVSTYYHYQTGSGLRFYRSQLLVSLNIIGASSLVPPNDCIEGRGNTKEGHGNGPFQH
jgi:hypothetical protein